MKGKINSYEDINYNPNTKGADFEKVVRSLLNDYLGSRFEFYNRAQIIDSEMEYLKILPHGSNELDVVGIFKNTIPKIVLKIEDTVLIPYDAVALISEVKYDLSKTNLENDLKKLANIQQLKLSPNRFSNVMGSNFMVQEIPFRLLVYFNKAIDTARMEALLTEYSHVWDAVFLVNEERVILNTTLPIANSMNQVLNNETSNNKLMIWKEVAFIVLLSVILSTIPIPFTVNVLSTISNIARFAYHKDDDDTTHI